MQIEITMPGGARVDAHVHGHTIATDQPPSGGGEDSAASPFTHFLASIGTCAGIYVVGFCRNRGIATDGISLRQHIRSNPASGMVDQIDLDIQVPPEFPEKYLGALERAVEGCAVKRHLEQPPQIRVQAEASMPTAAA